MNVLSIGSDRNLFHSHSESALRHIAYGEKFDTLTVIVFSSRSRAYSPVQLSDTVHIQPTSSRIRLVYIWDAFWLARRLARPDVVTVQDPFEAGLAGLVIAHWYRIPLHVQVHTDLYDPAFGRSVLNRVRLLIAGIVLRRAARIRTVSERIRHSIVARQPRASISVLPIFVDLERYRHAEPGALREKFARFAIRVLVVSRLEPEKNVGHAIRSFNDAAPEDACLIIVGDGSERRTLERMARKNVFFEGMQDAAPYYALADLIVVTSRYEGYGRTIIEALAAGKPVLSRDVGVAREAGAIIAEGDFSASLREWVKTGVRAGELRSYPYVSFDAYVERYCADIAAAATSPVR